MFPLAIAAIAASATLAICFASIVVIAAVFGQRQSTHINRFTAKMQEEHQISNELDMLRAALRSANEKMVDLTKACYQRCPPTMPDATLTRNAINAILKAEHAIENMINYVEKNRPAADPEPEAQGTE